MEALAPIYRDLVDLNGTASRKRGWIVFGGLVVVAALCQLAVQLQLPQAETYAFIALGPMLSLWLATLVQRLHDAGRSGYWALITLVPVLGLLAILVILMLKPAAPPRAHPLARKIGALGLVALVLVFLSRAFFWHPYWIPSESMKPTLLAGDYVIATKVAAKDLQRGDVLIYRHPGNGVDFVSRLIGLPGDTVLLRGGVVILNGEALPQVADGTFDEVYAPQGPNAIIPRCGTAPVAPGALCQTDRLIETLPGGRSHAVLNLGTMPITDDTDLITVPPGMIFVLGDHRDNSFDSRFALSAGGPGFVPLENVEYRARWVLFSANGALADPRSWRADRALEAVQ